MKHKVENNEIKLDARGLECPIPVLKARKLSQKLICHQPPFSSSIPFF